MTEEKCDRIMEGLIVDENGELALDESFQEHLDECSDCKELYDSVLAAKEEEVPDYVPAVMQKIRENCTYIVDGFIVDSEGELVLDESYKTHLSECSTCQELYGRVESAKKEKAPNYVPAVMKRIRKMESEPSSMGWWEGLKDGLAISFSVRRRAWASAGLVAIAAVVVALALRFIPFPSPEVDRIANMVSVSDTSVLTGIGGANKEMSLKLDELTSKRIQLLRMDSQGT